MSPAHGPDPFSPAWTPVGGRLNDAMGKHHIRPVVQMPAADRMGGIRVSGRFPGEKNTAVPR